MLCFPKNNTEYKNLILITFLIVLNSQLLENIMRLFASNKYKKQVDKVGQNKRLL